MDYFVIYLQLSPLVLPGYTRIQIGSIFAYIQVYTKKREKCWKTPNFLSCPKRQQGSCFSMNWFKKTRDTCLKSPTSPRMVLLQLWILTSKTHKWDFCEALWYPVIWRFFEKNFCKFGCCSKSINRTVPPLKFWPNIRLKYTQIIYVLVISHMMINCQKIAWGGSNGPFDPPPCVKFVDISRVNEKLLWFFSIIFEKT